jgi:hypothetical protein
VLSVALSHIVVNIKQPQVVITHNSYNLKLGISVFKWITVSFQLGILTYASLLQILSTEIQIYILINNIFLQIKKFLIFSAVSYE